MVALVIVGIFLALLAIHPRERAWASAPAREAPRTCGGGGALLLGRKCREVDELEKELIQAREGMYYGELGF